MEDEIHFVCVCPRFLALHQEPFAVVHLHSVAQHNRCRQVLKIHKRSYFECSIRSIFVYNRLASLVIVKVQSLTRPYVTRELSYREVFSSRRESTHVDVRNFLSRRREVFSGRRESAHVDERENLLRPRESAHDDGS